MFIDIVIVILRALGFVILLIGGSKKRTRTKEGHAKCALHPFEKRCVFYLFVFPFSTCLRCRLDLNLLPLLTNEFCLCLRSSPFPHHISIFTHVKTKQIRDLN